MSEQVTVAIPFHGCPDMLRHCLRSVLAQTHNNLQVIVIADGTKPGPLPRDSRLTVYRLPDNRGAYYARAIALAATTTTHHAIVDADDWIHPDWLAAMLNIDTTGAVQQGARWIEQDGHEPYAKPWKNAKAEPGSTFRHQTSHVGIYRTNRLRDLGGYSPAYRMSWDSLLVGLIRMTGPVNILPNPMYHRRRHPASLVQAPATKLGSPARLKVRAHLANLYKQAWPLRDNIPAIRDLALTETPAQLWEEVQEHAERLRKKG